MFAGALCAAVAAIMTAVKTGNAWLWPCVALLVLTGAARALASSPKGWRVLLARRARNLATDTRRRPLDLGLARLIPVEESKCYARRGCAGKNRRARGLGSGRLDVPKSLLVQSATELGYATQAHIPTEDYAEAVGAFLTALRAHGRLPFPPLPGTRRG